MRKLQEDFLDREVQVHFSSGTLIGTLEKVGDDGSLLIRQGKMPVWVPLGQVKYLTLVDTPPPDDDPEDETL